MSSLQASQSLSSDERVSSQPEAQALDATTAVDLASQAKQVAKYKAKVEPYLKEEYLNTLVKQANQLAEKYSQPEYINQLVNADNIKFEKKRAFNNVLLYEISLSRLLNFNIPHIPHVGIYTKDLLKLSFVSIDWLADWVLQQNLHTYFSNILFDQLTRSDKTLQILQNLPDAQIMPNNQNAPAPPAASEATPQAPTAAQTVYNLTQEQLRIPYASLYSGNLFHAISKHFLARQCAQAIKDHFLVQDATANNPVAIFSFIEERLLTNLILNSPQTNFLSWVNGFFKQLGYLPAFTESNLVHYAQKFALTILFIGWFNQTMLIPQWTNYVTTHHAELKQLLTDYHALKISRLSPGGCQLNVTQLGGHQALVNRSTHGSIRQAQDSEREQQKACEVALKKFIDQGQQLSFTTWLKLKNMKQAEWEFYYNLIISLPGWYRLTQVAYTISQQLLQKTSEQPASKPIKTQGVES